MEDPNVKRQTHEAGSFVGNRLISICGDDIGVIHELLIDPEAGQVASAVVSFHVLAGYEDSLFIIPWRALRADSEEHRFVLDLGKVEEVAAGEAGLEGDDWEWASNGRECFGFKPNRN